MSKAFDCAAMVKSRLDVLKHRIGFEDLCLNESLDSLIEALREPEPPATEYLHSFVRILSGRIDRVVKTFNSWRVKLTSQMDRLLDITNSNVTSIGDIHDRIRALAERLDHACLDQKTFSDQLATDHADQSRFSSNVTDAIENLERRLYVLTDERFKTFEKSIGELDLNRGALNQRLDTVVKYLLSGNYGEFEAAIKRRPEDEKSE